MKTLIMRCCLPVESVDEICCLLNDQTELLSPKMFYCCQYSRLKGAASRYLLSFKKAKICLLINRILNIMV